MADQLDKLMSKVGKLPTMPHVAAKILELVSDPDVSAAKLQRVIDSDQVLAVRILKVANSALYALPRKVKTLQQAIVMLGFNHIRSLVLAEAIQNMFKGGKGNLLEAMLWEHSVGTAISAKSAAKVLGSSVTEEAFVAGLTHDIGKLILLQGDPEGYNMLIEEIYREYRPFSELELARYEVDHAEVGGALASRWNLHVKLVEAIKGHHGDEVGDPLFDLVRLGNAVAWKAEWGFRKEPEFDLAALPCAQRLGVDAAKATTILEESLTLMASERETFGVSSLGAAPQPTQAPTPAV